MRSPALRSGKTCYPSTRMSRAYANAAARRSTQPARRRCQPFAASREAEPVSRRRAYVDLRCFRAHGIGEPLAHLLAQRRDPRILADQYAVRVDELPPRLADLSGGAPEQIERRSACPFRLAGWKQQADVSEPCRTEQRVDQRMRDHVAVRVAREAARRVDRDAPEHERNTVREGMRVDAEPDPELAHPSGSCRRCRRSKTLTVS